MNTHLMPAAGTPALSDREDVACWTRMQSEAGQGLARIFARKEIERRAGGGLFFWGVGNPPATATVTLARAGVIVPVYFSVMKSKPKAQDAAPERVVSWRRFVDAYGVLRDIPSHVVVTSRVSSRTCHYALVCKSNGPLALNDLGAFNPSDWRNMGGTGAPVGASQVTALVRRIAWSSGGDYRVAIRAHLAGGYWVKLVDPVEVSAADRAALEAVPTDIDGWMSLATKVKQGSGQGIGTGRLAAPGQLGLFAV